MCSLKATQFCKCGLVACHVPSTVLDVTSAFLKKNPRNANAAAKYGEQNLLPGGLALELGVPQVRHACL